MGKAVNTTTTKLFNIYTICYRTDPLVWLFWDGGWTMPHRSEYKKENEYILWGLFCYLQHDGADVSHTLGDGLWSSGDGDSSLC